MKTRRESSPKRAPEASFSRKSIRIEEGYARKTLEPASGRKPLPPPRRSAISRIFPPSPSLPPCGGRPCRQMAKSIQCVDERRSGHEKMHPARGGRGLVVCFPLSTLHRFVARESCVPVGGKIRRRPGRFLQMLPVAVGVSRIRMLDPRVFFVISAKVGIHGFWEVFRVPDLRCASLGMTVMDNDPN